MQSSGNLSLDLLSPIGYSDSSCGYCHSDSGSYSYYLRAKSLSTQFYQDLLNRGFRRSGNLIYKPDLRKSCCPHYTIRVDTAAFKASKDQRQALNRFNSYICGDEYFKEASRRYPKSKQEAARRNTEFNLCERVHEAEREAILAAQNSHPLASKSKKPTQEPAHKFEVTLESDEFTEEKYSVFENYQRIVHKEPPSRISKSGFKNFLCNTPLRQETQERNGKSKRLGSYHQCYRVDGKLVAVGVLDLLPQCVSAVYFMYHEDVHRWQFGKLGALREAALAIEDDYQYYYMGFYIHSCPKMKYKGDYSPQYILDPETYSWDILDDTFKAHLDAKKYVSMSRERRQLESGASNTDPASSGDNDLTEDQEDESSDMIFDRNVPGVMTREELLDGHALDDITLFYKGGTLKTSGMVFWEHGDIDDPSSVKGVVAELVAAVGEELARRMVVAF